MADTEEKAKSLRNVQKTQLKAGANTRLMSPDEIKSKYPFYNVKDIFLGSINTVDEGYWDGGTVFDWLRRSAIDKGVEYISNEVVGINKNSKKYKLSCIFNAFWWWGYVISGCNKISCQAS